MVVKVEEVEVEVVGLEVAVEEVEVDVEVVGLEVAVVAEVVIGVVKVEVVVEAKVHALKKYIFIKNKI